MGKASRYFLFLLLCGLGLLCFSLYLVIRREDFQPKIYKITSTAQKTLPNTSPQPTSISTTTPTPPALMEPIANFHTRITKKFFGTYVTPQNSPVQPERFIGYHTGVDVEYGDISGTVPVHAIASGLVAYSGWVSGYGGVIIIHHQINGFPHTALYGHLDPASLVAIRTNVTQGQQIGVLGVAYSHQTDNERRHLHFAIRADDAVNFLGYVQSKDQLSNWIDPLSLTYAILPN